MFQVIIEDRNAPKVEKSIDGYSGFLFYDDNGMPLVAMHWQHRFNHMVGRYNDIYRMQMPNIIPHVCRHTYCSNMAKSGMNPKTLQYLMGHSDISVTMNVYTHIGFDDAEEELKRMEDFRKAQEEVEQKKEKPMSQKMFKVVVPSIIIVVWMLTCYPVCNKAEGFDCFLYWIIVGCPFGIRRMCLWLIPKNFGISGSIGIFVLNCIIGGLIGGVVLIFKIIGIAGEFISIVTGHFWTKSSKVEIQNFWTFYPKVGQSGYGCSFIVRMKGAEKAMESMKDMDRVMEREIKKGRTPLKFEQLGFGDYSYNEITSKEKLLQVLSYLLRIGEYETFAGKTIGNNVYMDIRGKKVVFKRTRLTYERNNIFAMIKRLAKKYKPDYEGKVYLETVRCFFTISEEELEKCRYNYKCKDTYAFVMSDRYIMALYTYCLSARKAVALEDIELEGLSEAELSMVKLESVREVLFQALLLDDVKFEDGKMYAELCSILIIE